MNREIQRLEFDIVHLRWSAVQTEQRHADKTRRYLPTDNPKELLRRRYRAYNAKARAKRTRLECAAKLRRLEELRRAEDAQLDKLLATL